MAFIVEKQQDTYFEFEYNNQKHCLHNLTNLSGKQLKQIAQSYETELFDGVLSILCVDAETLDVVQNMKIGETNQLMNAWSKANNMTTNDFLESQTPIGNTKKK